MNEMTPPKAERAAALKGLGTVPQTGRGRPLHPRQGQLYRRHETARHAVRRFCPLTLRPCAHQSINTEAAMAVPGVVAVLTAADLEPLGLHWMPTLAGDKQMVLADGKVLFQGQEVAFVVASDRYAAADAVELVEVDYEELPVWSIRSKPKLMVRRSCARTLPIPGRRPWAAQAIPTTSSPGKRAKRTRQKRSLANAEVVAEEMVYYHRTHPCPLETCGAWPSMDKVNGKLTLLGHVPGAPCGSHSCVADLGYCRAQYSRDFTRYRRRFWQQGGRLSRLCLFHRGQHCHRQTGEMDRRPDGEPDCHGLCPRLLDAGQDRSDQRRQNHRAVVPYDSRPWRV